RDEGFFSSIQGRRPHPCPLPEYRNFSGKRCKCSFFEVARTGNKDLRRLPEKLGVPGEGARYLYPAVSSRDAERIASSPSDGRRAPLRVAANPTGRTSPVHAPPRLRRRVPTPT